MLLQLSLNAKGEVTDARALSGPEELRGAALSSALQWHFADESGRPATIESAISFRAPAPSRIRYPEHIGSSVLKSISWSNVPDDLVAKVRVSLPVRQGDQLTSESLPRLAAAVRSVDEHLTVGFYVDPKDNSVSAMIGLAGPAPAVSVYDPPPTEGVRRIRVGGNVQASKIISKVAPSYPPLAKQARLQGTVRYNVLIGADGYIKNMELAFGHPLLVEAATGAVQQWRYNPTLLNGDPAEVMTVIDVNFTLSQ